MRPKVMMEHLRIWVRGIPALDSSLCRDMQDSILGPIDCGEPAALGAPQHTQGGRE